MNYKVLATNNSQVYFAISDLEKQVQQYINEGWKPLGGVNITYVQHSNLFFVSQALTK